MEIINYRNQETGNKGALFVHGVNQYSACSAVASSPMFKSMKTAERWLEKKGYTKVE